MRKTYTFSMDSPECIVCSEYNSCKNKRRVSCMYLEPLIKPAAVEVCQPLMQDMAVKHEYRNVKVGENTTVTIDLLDLKKKLKEDFYKNLNCHFLNFGG